MSAITFTPQEYNAFIACWEAGHTGLPDRRWLAVEIALSDALGDLEGVDVELEGEALADAKSAFAAGWDGFVPSNPDEEILVSHMESAAVALDLLPAPSMRH